MPWVRFDDQFPIHRKVRGLSDPAYRLCSEAIFWCARNLTDGYVPAADLPDVATARRPLKFVPELVARGNWHLADEVCESAKCPANPKNPPERVGDGWLIHDYFDYQPTKAKVLAERAKNAERQKKWREQHHGPEPDSERNAVSNGVTNGRSNTAPSRPVPSRRDGGSLSDHSAGDQSVRARAREREAVRWLTAEYRLTDDESLAAWAEVQARAREPINTPVPYLQAMAAKGHLADIVAAVMRPPPGHDPPLKAVPAWCGTCDEGTRLSGDPDRPRRCPNCHPLRDQEAS